MIRVFPGGSWISVVSHKVNDHHVRALQRFLQSFESLLRVLYFPFADQDHDLSTLRKSFPDEFSGLASGGSVVGAEVESAVGRVGLHVAASLRRYADERWQRVAQVQRRAVRNGRIFHATGPVQWGRDLSLRLLGERLLDQPWLYR